MEFFSSTSLIDKLNADPDYLNSFWNGISNGDWTTVIVYIAVIFLGAFILIRGVKNGLEKANKLLIPSLFVLLVIIVFVSLSMEGGIRGIEYMFCSQYGSLF